MTQTQRRFLRILNKRNRRDAKQLIDNALREYLHPTLTPEELAAAYDHDDYDPDEEFWTQAYYKQLEREAIERAYYESFGPYSRNYVPEIDDDYDDFCEVWWCC